MNKLSHSFSLSLEITQLDKETNSFERCMKRIETNERHER